MIQYAIYEAPPKFPGNFVVRTWKVSKKGITPSKMPVLVHPLLSSARSAIPEGMINLGRIEFDDPSILEVWVPAGVESGE